jgi:hypothetical protein
MESILNRIKKNFTPRKTVDFNELEPVTALDEVKIVESLKGIDDNLYIDGLKRHSLACAIKKITMDEEGGSTVYDLSQEFIEYVDSEGKQKTKSSFLYMLDFLGAWPNAVINVLFEAFTNMQQEIETKVQQQSKFEFFRISEKPPEDKEPKMKLVPQKEDETREGLTDMEILERKVNKELDEADMKLAQGN